ncbi:MAG: hypothetical protein R3E31_10270 [Chloroflexota bacterium]
MSIITSSLTAVAITETASQLYLPIVVGGNGQRGPDCHARER